MVHEKLLLQAVLPRFFVCTKYETFVRTLKTWGFALIKRGTGEQISYSILRLLSFITFGCLADLPPPYTPFFPT